MVERFHLASSVVHLDGVGPLRVAANTAAFWADRQRPELTAGHVITEYAYDSTWDFIECHPDGDELAIVLTGSIDLHLGEPPAEQTRRLAPGDAGIIPAGTWHRLAVHQPSSVLFVTPIPTRTEHRPLSPR